MMAAVKVLLRGLGEDVTRDGLLRTPLRVAQAFQAAIQGYQQSAKEIVGGALFAEVGAGGGKGSGGGCGGMVVVRNIEVYALCEGCLLPFRLRCHVAYIPSGERVVGLSKIARVAELYAKRLQTPIQFVQERLTRQIAEAIGGSVMVVVEANHMCMLARGVQQHASSTVTYASLGIFASDASARTTFLQLVGKRTSR
ncbi:unnamed protein product [Sphagnum compactum]